MVFEYEVNDILVLINILIMIFELKWFIDCVENREK